MIWGYPYFRKHPYSPKLLIRQLFGCCRYPSPSRNQSQNPRCQGRHVSERPGFTHISILTLVDSGRSRSNTCNMLRFKKWKHIKTVPSKFEMRNVVIWCTVIGVSLMVEVQRICPWYIWGELYTYWRLVRIPEENPPNISFAPSFQI